MSRMRSSPPPASSGDELRVTSRERRGDDGGECWASCDYPASQRASSEVQRCDRGRKQRERSEREEAEETREGQPGEKLLRHSPGTLPSVLQGSSEAPRVLQAVRRQLGMRGKRFEQTQRTVTTDYTFQANDRTERT